MDSCYLQGQKLRNMKIRQILFSALALTITASMQGQDITESKFGKGILNVVAKDSSYSANFALRIQSLFTSSWELPEGEGLENVESNFLIRRARLKFGGFAYSPRLTYKVELGLSNRDIAGASEFTSNAPLYILDAVVKWNFHENFELWVGQTKLPGNRERLISSANLETVDRSLLNSRFNIDRDLGIQLHHYFDLGNNFIVREAVAISKGEGRNVTTENLGGYQYTGRLEVLPFGDFQDYSGADFVREPSPKLAVGASYDFNDDAVKTRSNQGSYMITDYGFYQTDVRTFFLDAMFKYEGISVMAEYADRNSEDPFATNFDGTLTGDIVNFGQGFNFQAGYLFKNNYQILGRYTNIDLDDEVTQLIENQYTLTLSKYIAKHKLKIQTDISYNDLNTNFTAELLYRLQFEFHL